MWLLWAFSFSVFIVGSNLLDSSLPAHVVVSMLGGRSGGEENNYFFSAVAVWSVRYADKIELIRSPLIISLHHFSLPTITTMHEK